MSNVPFDLPHASESAYASNPILSKPDKGDWRIVAAGLAKTGVLSGCAVTPQGSPNTTVAVAAGSVAVQGAIVSVVGGNLTIPANASGNDRIDLITVDSAGTKAVLQGTAAAIPNMPAVPYDKAVLSAVLARNGFTTVTAGDIVDKRVIVASLVKVVRLPIDFRSPGTNVAWEDLALTAWTEGHYKFTKDVDGTLYGVVTVPKNVSPVPNAKIVTSMEVNATSGVTRWVVSTARVPSGSSFNPASLNAEAAADITVPGTVRLRFDQTFPGSGVLATTGIVADDELIVALQHAGAHANDTVAQDTNLVDAWLQLDVF